MALAVDHELYVVPLQESLGRLHHPAVRVGGVPFRFLEVHLFFIWLLGLAPAELLSLPGRLLFLLLPGGGLLLIFAALPGVLGIDLPLGLVQALSQVLAVEAGREDETVLPSPNSAFSRRSTSSARFRYSSKSRLIFSSMASRPAVRRQRGVGLHLCAVRADDAELAGPPRGPGARSPAASFPDRRHDGCGSR